MNPKLKPSIDTKKEIEHNFEKYKKFVAKWLN